MKIKRKPIITVFASVCLAFFVSGCDVLMEDDAKVQSIVDAYKSADSEAFFKKMESDAVAATGLECYFEAINSNNTEGMNAVYQKVHELTQNVEISCEETDSYDMPVTIKTKDASEAIEAAMLEAAAEGPEAFADMPSWLLKGLDNAVDKEITVTFSTRNPDMKGFSMLTNHEFLEALTAGAYPYLGCTMTTCIDAANDSEYYMVASGDTVHYSTDYYYLSLEGFDLTEEDYQDLEADLSNDLVNDDGIASGILHGDNYIGEYMYINYDDASNYTLNRIGIVDSTDRSATISLKATISGFEAEGMTSDTTDFGSGVIEKRSQK
ncbi:MAG: hypothetical protein K2K74_00210 [Lachnospiraceae bacterium]|nr:hypothetical protein [Lachnospiraceae bacterium]